MIRFKSVVIALLIVSISFAQGKSAQMDSVVHLVDDFMKKANWAALYELTDTSFQKQIKKQVFVQQFTALQQTAWGKYDSLAYAREQKNYHVYKIYFDEFAGMMLLSLSKAQKIDGFAIRPYSEPGLDSSIQTNNPVKTLFEKKTDSLVRANIKRNYTVGVSIGIYENGQFSFYGYGETVKGNKQIPNKKNLFEIGSISKTFTAWILAQEAVKGTIQLDSSINLYLPDSISRMVYKDKIITVKSLSNHTSGIPSLPFNFKSIPGYTGMDPYAGYTQDLLFQYLKSFKPFKEPGKQLEYSNMAVGILGNILELKTGKTYEQLVKQRIAEPLKMKYTGLSEKQYAGMKQLNTSCYNGAGDVAGRWHFKAMSAAGSLYTNAEDILKYAKAVSETGNSDLYKSLELALQPTFTVNALTKIGLGWFMVTRNGNEYINHSGGTGGYRSILVIDRKNKKAIIVMSNVANDVSEMGFQIMDLLNTK